MKKFFILLIFLSSLAAQERIVSLSPSITEMLFALGCGKCVVATTTYSNYPKEAKKLPVIGNYAAVDLEKLFALKPTLVVAQAFELQTVEKLNKLGIKTITLQLDTLFHIQNALTQLADALNKEKEAQKLNEQIQTAIKNAKHSKTSKKVLVVFGLMPTLKGAMYVSGKSLFYNEILKICGDENVYGDKKTAQLVVNLEDIILRNPDAVIIIAPKNAQKLSQKQKALSNWQHLPIKAAKNGAVYLLEGDYIAMPSHRVAKSIEQICEVLE